MVKKEGPNLLSRNWLIDIKNRLVHVSNESSRRYRSKTNVLHKYSDVFKDEPGVLKDVHVDFHFDKNVKPIVIKANSHLLV